MSDNVKQGARNQGTLPLEAYAALGDGRSVAMVGADGSIDWWCVPAMDSTPLFDRLLDQAQGGRFSVTPQDPFAVTRAYRPHSNVLEQIFTTDTGRARVTDSLNSGISGRLPWSELARRVEGLEGTVTFTILVQPGHRLHQATPWREDSTHGQVLHMDGVLAAFRADDAVQRLEEADGHLAARLVITAGARATMALLAAADEPLILPPMADIDGRIDRSDQAWREWCGNLVITGPHEAAICRSALALKLLLFSPTGAIAAAATTSLPERLEHHPTERNHPSDKEARPDKEREHLQRAKRTENALGGDKNYDYRFAWVRDVAYSIKAFLRVGATEEARAAFSWLTATIRRHGGEVRTMYRLDGSLAPEERTLDLPGYADSRPVREGNKARDQLQLGIYGDILETASLFVENGHVLDLLTRRLLADLADRCADLWRNPDSGIWELEQAEHYTMSKIGCWTALDRALSLAGRNQIDTSHKERWRRERDRIGQWIDAECWSDARQAYTMHPGTDRLDASLLLAVRFGFDRHERLAATRDAVVRELSRGPHLYRYSGMEAEEGCFIACGFWLVEAYALLGEQQAAERQMTALLDACGHNLGLLNEQIDPTTGAMLGNVPQALSHLALIHAAVALRK